jgi:hypothetical protein
MGISAAVLFAFGTKFVFDFG